MRQTWCARLLLFEFEHLEEVFKPAALYPDGEDKLTLGLLESGLCRGRYMMSVMADFWIKFF
jgi:hypothetical protein